MTVRSSLFLPDGRRAFRLPEPAAQLKLPIYLLILTLAFGGFFAWYTNTAYERLYGPVIGSMPDSYHVVLRDTIHDFAMLSATLLVAYALLVLGLCGAYLHRLLGPLVLLRRHVQALTNGRYQNRVEIRSSDSAYREIAQDLNNLARSLEGGRKS